MDPVLSKLKLDLWLNGRVSESGSGGCRFESCQVRFFFFVLVPYFYFYFFFPPYSGYDMSIFAYTLSSLLVFIYTFYGATVRYSSKP